ncbi:MAG: hypothetical protein R3C61_22210 [Bacteroidia bacterium]
MKKINVLILDDNFVIANKVKRRLFSANRSYRIDSGIEIYPHYLEIDNTNPKISAKSVDDYVKENEIEFLLLDRGFGHIIEPKPNNPEELDIEYVYKDNTKSGFYIEHLLEEWKRLKKSSLKAIKGAIVYTYDDYRELNKQGEVIKDEIVNELVSILPRKCKLDVLLAYSDIYKIAEIDLYEGYAEEGVIKLGKKNEFVLYGIFVGELLYHKIIQMLSVRNLQSIKDKKATLLYRLAILYLIFISISVGGNAIFTYLFSESKVVIGVAALIFGLLLPFIILLLKPSILIDIDE